MTAVTTRQWWFAGAVLVVVIVIVIAVVWSGNSSSVPSGAGSASPSPTVSSPAPSPSPSTTPSLPSSASPVPSSAESVSANPNMPSTPGPEPSATAPSSGVATTKLAAMSLEQKVGQVLMVSSPVTGADANSLYALDNLYIGNVFMKGRSEAGQAGIGGVVSEIRSHVSGARTVGVRPFVATDQEGGFVQIMRGPGFADIPQAIQQGQLDVQTLQSEATVWGQQLASVGVNVNLAPVLDTVPGAGFAPQNAPIGAFGREFGYTPKVVSSHGIAFAKGMLAAGVAPTVKHFPGLGRVIGNTDVTAGVVDDVTVRNDAYVAPFRAAVQAGVPWLMISNASYPLIDPNAMAPFSSIIVDQMVREDLGFKGIIVSDDICDAVQVSGVPISQRGVDFLQAGGTMALCTNQTLVPQMYQGMVEAAQADPAFAAQVDAAALRVLQAKAAKGLIDK